MTRAKSVLIVTANKPKPGVGLGARGWFPRQASAWPLLVQTLSPSPSSHIPWPSLSIVGGPHAGFPFLFWTSLEISFRHCYRLSFSLPLCYQSTQGHRKQLQCRNTLKKEEREALTSSQIFHKAILQGLVVNCHAIRRMRNVLIRVLCTLSSPDFSPPFPPSLASWLRLGPGEPQSHQLSKW